MISQPLWFGVILNGVMISSTTALPSPTLESYPRSHIDFLTNLLPNLNRADCELVSYQYDIRQNHQQINLGTGLESQDKMRNFLQRNTRCVTAISAGNGSIEALSVANRTFNSNLVLINDNGPPKEFLKTLRRPLIWMGKGHTNEGNDPTSWCPSPLWRKKMNLVTFFGFPLTVKPSRLRPEISGWVVRYHQFVAQKFGIDLKIYVRLRGFCLLVEQNGVTKRWSEMRRISAKKCKVPPSNDFYYAHTDMYLSGRLNDLDLGPKINFARPHLVTRYPVPVSSFGEISRPFSLAVWIYSLVSVLALELMLFITYKVYSNLKQDQLIRPEESHINFLLYPFVKITEPDPLIWFTERWSTGKFLIFLWSIVALLLPIAYSALLRSHMVFVVREKPPETLQDVVENGRRVWIPDSIMSTRMDTLEKTGQTNTDFYRVAKLANRTGGYFNPIKYGGLHPDVPTEIQRDGALISVWPQTLNYMTQEWPEVFARWNVHVVEEWMAQKPV